MCGSCCMCGVAADGFTRRKLIVVEGGVAVRGRPTADQNTRRPQHRPVMLLRLPRPSVLPRRLSRLSSPIFLHFQSA
ncbi:hypothetical protein E2C01_083160 [Portunus trituberculatus]|uniref:Uncharacterized protein n=1 Tax=Portunus trituberculatus TaxID=210409 RepID=A0A5B7IUD8_PORTR|nr:hypothetical protein [Portunus trituberculatus]